MRQEKLQNAAMRAVDILKGNLKEYTYKFSGSNSKKLFYPITENVEWTTGFCTGTYWLAYELTQRVAPSTAWRTGVLMNAICGETIFIWRH